METNLKSRFALTGTASLVKTVDDLCLLQGKVVMEHPNKLIDSFAGVINLRQSKIRVPGQDEIAASPLLSRLHHRHDVCMSSLIVGGLEQRA